MIENNQLLKEPNIKPTAGVIASGLGAAHKTYTKFLEELARKEITLMDWRYYNDGKAWLSKGEYKWTTPRGTNKVKPLFWLSIWEGFFKVSFIFGESLRDEIQTLKISESTKDIIKNSSTMGKTQRFFPIVIDVRTNAQLKDIYILAQFRKEKVK